MAFAIGIGYGIFNHFSGSGRYEEEPYMGATTVLERSEFDEFSSEIANLIKKYDGKRLEKDALSIPYYSRRLIVQGTGEKLDLTTYGAKIVVQGPDDMYVMQFTTREATEAAYNQLQNLINIEYCELDQYAAGSESTGDYEAMSWGVSRIGADNYARHVKNVTNEGITVAVVDTGIYEHAFLAGRIEAYGMDYVDNDMIPDDQNGHGTHVAGTIVDCTPGLNVMILPVKVLGADGKGSWLRISLGIRYAVNQGAQVINLSLGNKGQKGISRTVDNAVLYAINRGCTVVAAAGNDNWEVEDCSIVNLDKCIVVSSVDSNLQKAWDSNWGSSIDFAAPGVNIVSCMPRFFGGKAIGDMTYAKDGTSMATPHITALAAMIKLENPDMTSYEIQEVMKEHCVDLGETGWDPYYGWGMPVFSNEEEEPADEMDSEVLEQEQTEESEQTDSLEGYREVLEEYQMLAENQFSRNSWEQAKYANEGVMNFQLQGFYYNVYYRLIDLAGDGEPELLISINEEGEPVNIVDIFGLQKGKPLALIESNESVGYRSTYYITKDNRIKNRSAGGALNVWIKYYGLAERSVIPELEDEYVYDGWDGEHYTHIDAAGSSESVSEDEKRIIFSDEDVDYGGEWILLYDGQTHQSYVMPETKKEDENDQSNLTIPIHIITDHDSTSATAYQGIFMNGDTFISLPLYTSHESGEAVGIAYRVTKPYRDENGYVTSDILETLGEIYDAGIGYEIRNEGESYGLSYQLNTVILTDHPVYNGTYTQVSNGGANMNPSDIWLNIPEESVDIKDDEASPKQNEYKDMAETSEYVLPDSDSVVISREQLEGLSEGDLRIARNEIYARHGRMFNSADLQQYFNAKSWYVPRYTPEEFDNIQYDILSDIEWENIKLILKMEEE